MTIPTNGDDCRESGAGGNQMTDIAEIISGLLSIAALFIGLREMVRRGV